MVAVRWSDEAVTAGMQKLQGHDSRAKRACLNSLRWDVLFQAQALLSEYDPHITRSDSNQYPGAKHIHTHEGVMQEFRYSYGDLYKSYEHTFVFRNEGGQVIHRHIHTWLPLMY